MTRVWRRSISAMWTSSSPATWADPWRPMSARPDAGPMQRRHRRHGRAELSTCVGPVPIDLGASANCGNGTWSAARCSWARRYRTPGHHDLADRLSALANGRAHRRLAQSLNRVDRRRAIWVLVVAGVTASGALATCSVVEADRSAAWRHSRSAAFHRPKRSALASRPS